MEKIIQIAISSDLEGENILYALTEGGKVYWKKERGENNIWKEEELEGIE